jgi:translation elongation factor EF-Tu-like GTPase
VETVFAFQALMSTEVGTFTVEDAFYITGRGWVVVGTLTGEARFGSQLAFPSGLVTIIKSIELIRTNQPSGKIGLLLSVPFTKRQRPDDRQVLDQQVVGKTARILE